MGTTELGSRATLVRQYQLGQVIRLAGDGTFRRAASMGELQAAPETPIFEGGSTIGPLRSPTVVMVQAGAAGCVLTVA